MLASFDNAFGHIGDRKFATPQALIGETSTEVRSEDFLPIELAYWATLCGLRWHYW
jgi:hypothetical protein